MKNVTLISLVVGAATFVAATAIAPIPKACAQPGQMSFKDDIVPIFNGYCISCHQPGGQGYEQSGMDLRTYESLMKGTKFGPMVIPKEPDASSLIAIIYGRASPRIRMPFGHKPLPDCLRSNIWTWIFQGAKDN